MMNTLLKNRYSVILMGSMLISSGLQAMLPAQEKAKNRIKQLQAEMQVVERRLAELEAQKQERIAREREQARIEREKERRKAEKRAAELRDQELLKALQGRCAQYASLLDITHKLENRNAGKDASKDIAVTIEVVDKNSPDAPEAMRDSQDCMGLTSPGRKKAHVWVNSGLKDFPVCQQIHTILHELAHAYDANLRLPEDQKGYHNYPHIQPDMLSVVRRVDNKESAFKDVSFDFDTWYESRPWREWHADWQAIQWMREYNPREAQNLKKYYQDRLANAKRENKYAPEYAAYYKMIQWLS
jgi:hypothetical protein